MFNLSDTICAVCTPQGIGSIAAIRISGADSWEIAKKIFRTHIPTHLGTSALTHFDHMQAQHGYIIDKDQIIDEVIILPFKVPKSFTAEDVIEIYCHGGYQLPSQILDLCLKLGARQAKSGEFTFRAFVNGRIDLASAEAVNDLINADNERSAQLISGNLIGSLSKKVSLFRERLLHLITSIESSIEFPTDVPSMTETEILSELKEINLEITELIKNSNDGHLLKTGVKVSIIGPPNAGKSSLLNRLLENQRAIVSCEPGTTRDTVEEKVILNGLPVVLVDTAGIRDKALVGEVEGFGIERTKQAIQNSDMSILVFDLANEKSNGVKEIQSSLKGKTIITVGNKLDLANGYKTKCDVAISAKYGTNIDLLKTMIAEKTNFPSPGSFAIHINQRQKELLLQCNFSLQISIDMLDQKASDDLVADELKKSVTKLDEISGRVVSDEVIKNIFTQFCIGK